MYSKIFSWTFLNANIWLWLQTQKNQQPKLYFRQKEEQNGLNEYIWSVERRSIYDFE